MKKNSKKRSVNKDLFYENLASAKRLNTAYYEVYQKLVRYLDTHQKDLTKMNIMLGYVIDDLVVAQEKGMEAKIYAGKDFKEYLKKIEKGIDFKEERRKRRDLDWEKYVISSLWFCFMAFIVVQFIKGHVHDAYVINFSIDVLIAILCFYFGLNNFLNIRKIILRYQFPVKFLSFYLVVLAFCIITVAILPPSPFDVTLIILFLTHFLIKRKIQPLFEQAV